MLAGDDGDDEASGVRYCLAHESTGWLNFFSHKHCRSPLSTEPSSLFARGVPYIEGGSQNIGSGIVYKKTAEVFTIHVNFHVTCERKDARVGCHNSRAHPASAARCAFEAILCE